MANLSGLRVRSLAIKGLVQHVTYRGLAISSTLKAPDVKEVPVATYARGKKPGTEHTTISIDESKTLPKAIPNEDSDRKAVAFDGSVMTRLTPTMRNFTLGGKVAVVTGYVLS